MDDLKQEFGKFQIAFFAWKNDVNRHTERLDGQCAENKARIDGLEKQTKEVFEPISLFAKIIRELETRVTTLEQLNHEQPKYKWPWQ